MDWNLLLWIIAIGVWVYFMFRRGGCCGRHYSRYHSIEKSEEKRPK